MSIKELRVLCFLHGDPELVPEPVRKYDDKKPDREHSQRSFRQRRKSHVPGRDEVAVANRGKGDAAKIYALPNSARLGVLPAVTTPLVAQ